MIFMGTVNSITMLYRPPNFIMVIIDVINTKLYAYKKTKVFHA
jgi:hypothetical protein